MGKNNDSLFVRAEASRWRVTVWHPTIPPQRAGEFDLLEYAAAIATHTNR